MPRRNLSISSMPGLRVNPLAELSDDDDEGQLPQYQLGDTQGSGSGGNAKTPKRLSSRSIAKTPKPAERDMKRSRSGKSKRDRFRVETALSHFGTRKLRQNSSQEMVGASITEAGHLVGTRSDKLAMFEREELDIGLFVKAHFSNLTEKGVAILRSDLVALDTECAEEVRGTVYDRYMSFIHACQGIADLESSMQQLRDILVVSTLLIANMKIVAAPPSLLPGKAGGMALFTDEQEKGGDTGESEAPWKRELEALEAALRDLDVRISERRLKESCNKFKEVQELVMSISTQMIENGGLPMKQSLPARKPGRAGGPSWAPPSSSGQLAAQQLLADLEERRQILSALVDKQIQEPTCSDREFSAYIKHLAFLGGPAAAVKSMLNAYSSLLKRQQMGLLKPFVSGTGGSTGDGVDYAGALSHHVFSTMAKCLDKLQELFGDEEHLSSLLLAWAVQEAERCSHLLRRHALAAHASAGGVLASAQCIGIVLVYCCQLEDTHGLSLTAHIMKQLWPALDSVIQKRLRRIADEVKQVVTEEVVDDRLVGAQVSTGQTPTSATLLAEEVRSLLSDVAFGVLNTPLLARTLRQGIISLFGLYTSTIARTLKKRKKTDVDLGQDAIKALVELIATTLLPDAASKHKMIFGELCSPADFQRHISDLMTALKAS